MRRLVVIGASLAGLRAAQAARKAGFDGELTVVGDEPHFPYTRPPLSKGLLTGAQSPAQCALPCASVDAHWRLGTAATELDRARKAVRLSDGETLSYDRLIIATGCRARTWSGEGAGLGGVYTLRTLDDAAAFHAALRRYPRLVIVGAGFIGCEAAASARRLGLDVAMVDIADLPMSPFGLPVAERCAELHSRSGVDLRLGRGVHRLVGTGFVEGVELTDGTRIPADLVLIALGAVPNAEWLHGSGVTLDPGVVCDATLTAQGDPDVLAAGDVAAWPHELADGALVRVEHWTSAAEHGQLAGRNALLEPDERTAQAAPPYFWSDQYDVKIQVIGFPARADRHELVESTPGGDRFVAAGTRRGRLVSVVAWAAPRRLAWYRRQLAAAATLDEVRRTAVADPSALGVPAEAAA